jgi:hypothetical protein
LRESGGGGGEKIWVAINFGKNNRRLLLLRRIARNYEQCKLLFSDCHRQNCGLTIATARFVCRQSTKV